jgi:hypothetical protein
MPLFARVCGSSHSPGPTPMSAPPKRTGAKPNFREPPQVEVRTWPMPRWRRASLEAVSVASSASESRANSRRCSGSSSCACPTKRRRDARMLLEASPRWPISSSSTAPSSGMAQLYTRPAGRCQTVRPRTGPELHQLRGTPLPRIPVNRPGSREGLSRDRNPGPCSTTDEGPLP